MAVREITVRVIECECNRCGYIWQPKGKGLPKICSRCKSVKWNDGGSSNGEVEVKKPEMINRVVIPDYEIKELEYDLSGEDIS